MPLNFSAAHSSRITKKAQHGSPLLKRSSSSPFAKLSRRKPVPRSQSKPEAGDDEDFLGNKLDDIGLVKSLADLSLRDVSQAIQYIQEHTFDNIPEGGGFNSTHIAEILNFRKSLPPTVTVAHVRALLPSPTATEKEIAELGSKGTLRRIFIPGRGIGRSFVGEGLALSKDINKILRSSTQLDGVVVGTVRKIQK